MSAQTIYRKDYKPYPFEIEKLDLSFDLYDSQTFVEGKMRFKRVSEGELRLYGDDLKLISIHLDGKALTADEYAFDGQDLILPKVPTQFELIIKTQIEPQNNTHLSGLYRSNQIFSTQCEAEGFRRILYFPDRPDVLTTYTTRICADKTTCPVLLSNGNLKASGDIEQGRHWALWEDPFKKPSYLFALVAGQLACVSDSYQTVSGRKVGIHFYVESGQEDKCDHAIASLKNAMHWDEVNYGREYDLDIYMVVAVSDFNMGAMENKGLNIFNTKYILANPKTATDMDYVNVESVVGHEYFHNWTGNRVTCRDWFQLSLKEGLTVFREQCFSADQFAADVKRIDDVKVLRNHQFPEDAGPMAHPVRPESYEEINNFYTATIYNKGAEVIRMQRTLLGETHFRQGMDLYFEKNDGKAVTIDDFVAAMQAASGKDLTQFKRWYSQPGTPEVHVQRKHQAGKLRLTMKQSCPLSKAHEGPFHIPIRIALFQKEGERLALNDEVLCLTEQEQTFEFENIPEETIVSLLRDFSAPVKLHFEQSDEALAALVRFETDGYAKWEAMQQLALGGMKQTLLDSAVSPFKPILTQVYPSLLNDTSIEPALCAELLSIPGFEAIASTVDKIDAAGICQVQDSYRDALVNVISESAFNLVQGLWAEETGAMQPEDFARRRLRHACLTLLCKADIESAWQACEQQFHSAKTMSDEGTCLGLLAASPLLKRREAAIEAFYQRWEDEALVLDKWFTAQAMADLPETFENVNRLLSHSKFSFKNPNKVRALIGAFSQGNPRQFHHASGQGYAFLADMVLKLNSINPQVAARLVTPLIRYRRFSEPQQRLMHQALERLASQSLCKDVSEIVMKALGSTIN